MTLFYKRTDTPVGRLTLVARGQNLAAILWEHESTDDQGYTPVKEQNDHPVLLETEKQLQEYFAGARKTFSLALDFTGTGFQKCVWAALSTIPYGETRSYAQIAAQIGKPKAVRAVGAANGKNPIPIIVPCHRVIGSNGTLTGFAGGLKGKSCLLELESPQPVRLL